MKVCLFSCNQLKSNGIISMSSVYVNASIARFLSHTRFFSHGKWRYFPCSHFLTYKEEEKTVCSPLSRIICTDSKLKDTCDNSYEQEKSNDHECANYEDSFLKENFHIIDNRYFKLITFPNDSCHFEELLHSKEFKNVLYKSSFQFDVNLADNSTRYLSQIHAVYLQSSDDLIVDKKPKRDLNQVFCAADSESQSEKSNKPSEEQLLNVINSLTYSLINFFKKPQDYSVYHKNVVFQNNIKGVVTKGLNAYMQSMYFLKLYGHFHYAKVKVEVLKITHHTEDGTIRVRWRVNGVSRQKVLFLLWKLKSVTWTQFVENEAEWLDGFSVFSVGPDGLIYKHVCDKMMPDDDLVVQKRTDLKTQLLGLLGLSPRGATAGTLSSVITCYHSNHDLLSPKKLS